MEKTEKHWSFEKEINLQECIAIDFIAQVEQKIEKCGLAYDEIAKKLGITEKHLKKILNNPGNLTLKKIIKIAESVNLLVSIITYDFEENYHEVGPVFPGVFVKCWKMLDKPITKWDLDRLTCK